MTLPFWSHAYCESAGGLEGYLGTAWVGKARIRYQLQSIGM
jgi:hypothetical protein